NPEYHLVWVFRKQKGNGFRNYHVLPIKNKEFDKFMSAADKKQRQRFINDYRAHLKKNNINVPEADLPIK
ncbi:MAG: hypothetical protein U9Q83_01515, partial [Bacteroidota bacterium]|nr:hypothetical protein [Bacteroidota bacterium]